MDLPRVIGRYEVLRLLGQGGMGRVLLARDTILGRHVAIKTLREDLGLPPELRDSLSERMRNEAKAAATLSHPNMVTLHDMGEDPDVGLYLVFEYVEGPTLREQLAEGPLTPLDVARMARELGAALTHAHEAGVIHRDVKPENIILTKTGSKLTDFGIARIPDSTLTQHGMMLGTPAYSAPEALARGEFSPASDLFSLAATLYEALSGNRAFGGGDALATASAIANDDPVPLAASEGDLHRRLMLSRVDGVLSRAFSKDKDRRYTSCQFFGDALATAIDTRASGAYPIVAATHSNSIVPRATRRWQNFIAAAGLLVIIALVLLGRQREEKGVSLARVQNDLRDAVTTVPTPIVTHPVIAPIKPKPATKPNPAPSASAAIDASASDAN